MTFKPLLSATIEDTAALRYPVLISCKLDGIRCVVIDGVACSRNLKPLRNAYVQACIGKPEYNGLDGELIVGNVFASDCYRQTNSGVMSGDGEPDFQFHVFDRVDMPEAMFHERLGLVPSLPFVEPVPHWQVDNEAQLLEIEANLLARGAEGVMVRSLGGAYKFGRSTLKDGILGKLKRMASDEAEILAVIELERNMNVAITNALGHTERSTHKANKVPAGIMGALLVRCLNTGVLFQIGTGFSDVDRVWFWANKNEVVGKMLTYNHFQVGRKELPRFPSYKGLRSVEDM